MSMKLKSRIMHKGTRGHEITERQQRINVAISKTRYKVERQGEENKRIRETIKQNSINKRIFENKKMKLQHK